MIKQYDNYLANLEQLATKIGRDPMSVESQRGARYLVDSLAIALEAHCLLSHGGNPHVHLFIFSIGTFF